MCDHHILNFWSWGFCTVCEVNFATTFWEPLWVPSSLVMSQNVNEQQSGVLPYRGVQYAVCSGGQSDLSPQIGHSCTLQTPPTLTPPLYTAAPQCCSFTFWLMTSEDGTHSGSHNVVGKFTSHTVQKPQNQKSIFIPWRKSKINIIIFTRYSVHTQIKT
jgi:hypothetical protein